MSIFDFFRKSKPEEPKQEVLDEPSPPNIALDSSSYVNDSEVSLKKREFYTAVFLDRYSTGTPIMDDTNIQDTSSMILKSKAHLNFIKN